RVCRINRYDIEISRNAQVLKSVVKNNDVCSQVRYGPVRGRHAIGITDYCGVTFQFFSQQISFVTCTLRAGENFIAIRNDYSIMRIKPAVTSCEDTNASTLAC